MKRYDATYSAAMFVASFVLSASLMSSVHYRTLEHLDGVANYVMYPMGLATLFLGAFMLVKPASVVGRCISDGERGRGFLDDPAGFDRRNKGYQERLLNDG